MRYCYLRHVYYDDDHIIPSIAVIEANYKLQEYNMNNRLGSFIYGMTLIDELKEKYKRRDSSDGRAED